MKKAKIIIIITVVLVAIVGIYLNRAYAYIYSKFETTQPPVVRNYMTEKSQRITYVAIGDSLTAGVGASSVSSTFPALLAEKISAQKGVPVAVKNLGIPGATSFDLLTGAVLDAGQYKPEIITIFIGTNDIHNFVPLDKFKSNLLTSIEALKRNTGAEIYLINIPYLGARDLVLPPFDLYFDRELKKYNTAVSEVATETGVKLVDLYGLSRETQKTDPSFYSSDRFHPADQGYKLWSNLIYGVIK
jgi:lysophospholipase L1-like esterase